MLVAWTEEVKEFTRDKKVVFRYAKSPDNSEIGTCERLANGNTLVTELGKRPRLLPISQRSSCWAPRKATLDFHFEPEIWPVRDGPWS